MKLTEINQKGVGRLLVVAGLGLGVLATQQAFAGISATKHNLGSSGTGENKNTGTAELCVFCHTPHASNTNVKAPLWNKALPNSTYSVYNTSVSATIDGSVNMTGVSLACLSCHDGTQAMDNVINAPGSGGYNASGSQLSASGWTGARNSAGLLTNAGGFIANLGTDLTNDHPVGIQYCGGGYSTGSASTTDASTGSCADKDFVTPATGTIGGATAWWVNTTASGSTANREKTDMILYARAVATTTNNGFYQPFVECASCHDPHSTNTTFLRIENTNSAVCLACHNK